MSFRFREVGAVSVSVKLTRGHRLQSRILAEQLRFFEGGGDGISGVPDSEHAAHGCHTNHDGRIVTAPPTAEVCGCEVCGAVSFFLRWPVRGAVALVIIQ